MLIGCKTDKKKQETKEIEKEIEMVTEKNESAEWVAIFDGTTLDGWHSYLDKEVGDNWAIEDGALKFTPPADRKTNKSLDIVTDKSYSSFIMSLEWKVSKGGNSGIFWGVQEDAKYFAPYQTAMEIQVLDNERHPDAKVGGKTHQAGALYDMIPPSQDVANPAESWNLCVIEINHNTNKGRVWLNEVEIVSFPLSGPEWEALIENSKFKGWDGFGIHKAGKIGLQDHNDIVWYRDIKIKEL
jgi:hypothetical protein